MAGFLRVICLLVTAVSQAFVYAECAGMSQHENTFSQPLFVTALSAVWSGVLALSDIFFAHRFRLLTLIGIIWLVQLIMLLKIWLINVSKDSSTSVLMKVYRIPWMVIVLAAVFAAQLFLYGSLGAQKAQIYSGALCLMIQPLLMLKMLDDRRSPRGQSRSVAIAMIVSSAACAFYGLLKLNLMLCGSALIALLFSGIYYWALQGYQAAESRQTVHIYDLFHRGS